MAFTISPTEVVEQVMRNGLNPRAYADLIEALGGNLAEDIEAGAGGAITLQEAEIGATALMDLTLLPLLGAFLILICLYAAVRRVLLGIVGGINLPWGIPQHLQQIVKLFYPDPGPQVQWVDDKIGQLAGSLWKGWVQWLDTVLPSTHTLQQIGILNPPAAPSLDQLWKAIHQLESVNAYQQREIAELQSRLGQPSPAPLPNIIPLEVIVDGLSGKLSAQQEQIGGLQQGQQVQGQALTQFRTDLAQLSGELHAVSLTVTNWPEIESGLQQQLSVLQQDAIALTGDVADHTFKLTHLWPLDLLTYAGAAGLGNLVKLERNPCQCPKFLDIPNELGTALAVYEFLTSG